MGIFSDVVGGIVGGVGDVFSAIGSGGVAGPLIQAGAACARHAVAADALQPWAAAAQEQNCAYRDFAATLSRPRIKLAGAGKVSIAAHAVKWRAALENVAGVKGKIRTKPFPERAKGMRHATYQRLKRQAEKLEAAHVARILSPCVAVSGNEMRLWERPASQHARRNRPGKASSHWQSSETGPQGLAGQHQHEVT